MATVTPKPLIKGILLGTSADGSPGQYLVPADTTAEILSMTITNTDSSDRTVTVYLVASGESEGPQYAVIAEMVIAANGSLTDQVLRLLGPGDYISAVASEADVVAFRVDGAEIT